MNRVPKATWNKETDRWETLEPWGVYSAILPRSGMTRGGQLYELQISEHRITEKESLCLLPTPTQTDYKRDGSAPSSMRRKSPAVTVTKAHFPRESESGSPYGRYAQAVKRWSEEFRPAPAPTFINEKGQERLDVKFAEWMMGLPDGWVTDVPGLSRAQQIKAIGNGVVPQQAAAALLLLKGI